MPQGYALNTDFTAVRGDTLDIGKLISNNESSNLTAYRNGSVINLTSAQGIRMTAVRDTVNPVTSLVFAKTIGAGVTVVTPASGTFTITVSPSDTSSLEPVTQYLHYDIQVTDSAGVVTTVYRGLITLLADQSLTVP